MQLTLLPTPAPTDDDNDSCHDGSVDNDARHHVTQQPIDLLTMQREIHQTMTSMQLLFDLLQPQPTDPHSNQSVKIEQTIDMTTTTATTNAVYQPTKTHTLGKYLSLLCTPTCFVRKRMLHQSASHPITHMLMRHTAKPTIAYRCSAIQDQSTTPAHFNLASIHIASATPHPSINTICLTHIMITHVLPKQLDCPLDHPSLCPNHTTDQFTFPI